MNRQELLQDFKSILKEHVDNQGTQLVEHLSENTDLVNDLGIDSLDVVNIVIDIENRYKIEIDNEAIGSMSIVRNCIDLIEAKLAAPAL